MKAEYKRNGYGEILNFSHMSSSDTRRLNEIAESLRKPYTKFVDECCEKFGGDTFFWATPLASRNIYNDSDTFLSLCRIMLALELLKERKIFRIVTEYRSEQQVLESITDGSIQIDTNENAPSVFSFFSKKLRDIISFARFCLQELSYMRHFGKDENHLTGVTSVVITPVLSSSFSDSQYDDRYFKGITAYKNVIFIPQLINNVVGMSAGKFVTKIRNCANYRFLNVYSFLNPSDLFEIIKHWKIVDKVSRNTFVFQDFDISPIIRRGLKKGKINTPAFDGILARQIIRRMSEAKLPVNNFILWYEGRPSDVMVASAVREFFPNAACTGFEGYPLEEINPSICISEYQYRTNHSPQRMAIPGKAYEPLAHCFCEDIQLIYIPVMRNEYVLRKSVRKTVTSRTILVVLSYFPDVSREILNGINRYMRNNNSISCRIKLKNHPVNMNYTVADYGAECDSYSPEFISGTLNDSLRDADIVITSATSSTLEILFSGIPLIIMYPNGKLGYTALPPKICDDLYQVVYEDELSEAIDRWLNAPSPDNSVLDGMLVEKTPESVGQMFCGLTDNN